MNRLILEDELGTFKNKYLLTLESYLNPPKFSGWSAKDRFAFENFIVVTDGNPLGSYYADALTNLCNLEIINSVTVVEAGGKIEKSPVVDYEKTEIIELGDVFRRETCNRTAAIICLDCEKPDGISADRIITTITNYLKYGKDNRVSVNCIMPSYPAIPGEITSLAEREFSYYIEEKCERTAGLDKYIGIEKICREVVGKGFTNINLIRVDNLFGPGCNMLRFFDIDSYIEKAFSEGKVEITSEDYEDVYTCSFVRDAAIFTLKLLYTARPGHVHNYASGTTSIAGIKSHIRSAFSEELSLTVECEKYTPRYHCLNTLKFYNVSWKRGSCTPVKSAVYTTVCYNRDVLPENKSVNVYSGKLPRIQSLEVMILRDIDEICKRHNINYFICGGSMLGAIRYGHSIPWDDDLDIGMLREDFDKFREVCEKELPGRYTYSCHYNESGSHYIVDKVRLNGTYFSTRYSSIQEYNDGIFVDILVYDASADDYKLADLHGKTLYYLSKAIITRWYGHPMGGKASKKQKLLLPFMNKIPLSVFHKIYEKDLTLFKNKENPVWFVDGVGKKQADGPCLIEGLDDLTTTHFDEDFEAPIPKDCTNYLTYAYGPDFITEPRLSSRSAPHNFARIDLGEYIFESKPEEEFRQVNVKGELFEVE